MKRKNESLVALLGAVLCACACLTGCERKEAVSPEPPAQPASNAPAAKAESRADDAAYQAQLRESVAEQRRTMTAREKIRAQMDKVRERAKKALPPGATDAQVVAEIEGNPQRYPAWRELVAAQGAVEDEVLRNRAAAQAAVRRRVLREVAEQAKKAPSAAK